LHACVCVRAGHGDPPNAGCVVIRRDCDWTPPPHVLEQVDQVDHAPTAQLTGHACVLHACVCLKVGHAKPPYAVQVNTDRD